MKFCTLALAVLLFAAAVHSATYSVTVAPNNQWAFGPNVLNITVGDTVTYVVHIFCGFVLYGSVLLVRQICSGKLLM